MQQLEAQLLLERARRKQLEAVLEQQRQLQLQQQQEKQRQEVSQEKLAKTTAKLAREVSRRKQLEAVIGCETSAWKMLRELPRVNEYEAHPVPNPFEHHAPAAPRKDGLLSQALRDGSIRLPKTIALGSPNAR